LLALFLAASVRGTLLLALLLGLRLALRRVVPARVFAAAWVVVAVVWLLPCAIPVDWSPFNLAPHRYLQTAVSTPDLAPDLAPAVPLALRETTAVSPAPRLVAPSAAHAASSRERLGRWLTAGWLGVAAALVALRGLSMLRLGARLRGGPAPDARVTRAVRDLGAELGLDRLPDVVMTDLVSSPALCGVVRVRLLFPTQLSGQLTESELRWVILHELGHFRRRDLWTLHLLQLAAAVQWFNPCAWLALRLGLNDTELACDEFVLRHAAGAEPSEYGGVLLKVLSAQRSSGSLPASVGIVENKRLLLRRFAMITRFRPIGVARVAASLALLGGFAVVGLTQEKPAALAPASSPARPLALSAPEANARAKERLARLIDWEEHGKLELRAVGDVGGVPVAIIDVEGEPVLVTRHAGIMGLRVEEIDLKTRQVTMETRNGLARVLNLTNPETVDFPKVVAERFLTPQAQARRIESMRYGPSFPPELVTAWSKINREGKLAIIMSYLQGAEVVQIYSVPAEGGITVSKGFLFSEQLQALDNARRDRFIASLSPEQKAEFKNGASRAIRFTDPPEKIAQARAEAEQAAVTRAKVLAGLTPEQKALYDEWHAPSQPESRPGIRR